MKVMCNEETLNFIEKKLTQVCKKLTQHDEFQTTAARFAICG
jgi:hypothetical protein